MLPHLALEFCKRTDPRYKAIRDRHYVPNKGAQGQQLHFLVLRDGDPVGIISAGSCAYGTAPRDRFFGITQDNRVQFMHSVIDNTVFRLEFHSGQKIVAKSGREVPAESLATQVLALWRKVVPLVWFDIYHAIRIGYETFVVETDTRKGALYKADNWTYQGETAGSSKSHKGLNTKSVRRKTDPKMVFARTQGFAWMDAYGEKFVPTWRGNTPEVKQRKREVAKRRSHLMGRVFFLRRFKNGAESVSFSDGQTYELYITPVLAKLIKLVSPERQAQLEDEEKRLAPTSVS